MPLTPPLPSHGRTSSAHSWSIRGREGWGFGDRSVNFYFNTRLPSNVVHFLFAPSPHRCRSTIFKRDSVSDVCPDNPSLSVVRLEEASGAPPVSMEVMAQAFFKDCRQREVFTQRSGEPYFI